MARVRRLWTAWRLPLGTFLLIAVFVFGAFLARDGLPTQDDHPDRGDQASADAAPAEHVTTRTWRAIAADPAAHPDARVVLWGQVTAFDPAADPATLRAMVDSARHAPVGGRVNYPTPVLLHADPNLLQGVRKGYIFRAEVTTGPGGEVTATAFRVTDKTVG